MIHQRVEQFFSKEIDIVISDAPEWKLRNPSSSPAIISPGTPASGSAIANSPWSPVTTNKSLPQHRTRVETILERARVQSKGTSDVIESAYTHGIKVWALHKIQDFLSKLKAKFNGVLNRNNKKEVNNTHHTRSQSASADLKAWQPPKQLSAPYFKFEVTHCAYRPVTHEFKHGKFPKLYYTGRAGTSPFLLPEYTVGGATETKKLKDIYSNNRGKKRPRSPAKTVAPPTPTTPNINLVVKPPRKQAGFCEICDLSFSDLQPHLDGEPHRACVATVPLWNKLDLTLDLINCNSEDSVHVMSDGRN